MGALVAGALSEAERAVLADHAASCDRCHALIAALVETGAPAEFPLASDATVPGNAPNPDVPFELERGTQIGRYVIEERLGAGGMGVVYAAQDSELQRRVAVKLLRPGRDDPANGDARKRLLREARTLARLSHPNVVTLFDVGEHHGQRFVAMELVDGGSLSAWLRRTPRAPDEILDRLLEAARGLAAAHQAGVIHRDIKPDNILVGSDGRARVTDFGLARRDDTQPVQGEAPSIADPPSLTRPGMLVGTPVYMAPEQLAGIDADARTDQWSFCMTLYEALAGVRPFGIVDLAARASAIRDGRLAPPAAGRHVPGWVRRIVVRGLRDDPAERWPSIDAIVEALARGRNRRWRSMPSMGQTARQRRRAGIAIASLVSIAGITTFAATRGAPSTSTAPVAPMPGSAAVAASAIMPASATRRDDPPASAITPASAATRRDDLPAVATARLHDALTAFVTWSSAHAGAPCPSARDLTSSGDAHALEDPWGHAIAITCTDQPADQIAGAVSAGPDGAFGTDDDLASWALGPDVTGLVRGTRWRPAVAPPPRPTVAAPKRLPKLVRPPATEDHAPKATAANPPSPSKPPPALDGDGIPTGRWDR